MSITKSIIARWVEVTVTVPHSTDMDMFDHTADWRMVVFSNGRSAIECQTIRVWQQAEAAEVTMKLRQHEYTQLEAIIG
jgi:hypothetical protein